MVLDPFSGCATTPVAAERLGRQWVGMDIWDGAIEEVRRRMADNRQLLVDIPPDINYQTTPPQRTDGGEPATLTLRTPTGRAQRYPAPELSTAICWPTWARSARASGRTTPLTPVCWRLTTSTRVLRAGPTPTKT